MSWSDDVYLRQICGSFLSSEQTANSGSYRWAFIGCYFLTRRVISFFVSKNGCDRFDVIFFVFVDSSLVFTLWGFFDFY